MHRKNLSLFMNLLTILVLILALIPIHPNFAFLFALFLIFANSRDSEDITISSLFFLINYSEIVLFFILNAAWIKQHTLLTAILCFSMIFLGTGWKLCGRGKMILAFLIIFDSLIITILLYFATLFISISINFLYLYVLVLLFMATIQIFITITGHHLFCLNPVFPKIHYIQQYAKNIKRKTFNGKPFIETFCFSNERQDLIKADIREFCKEIKPGIYITETHEKIHDLMTYYFREEERCVSDRFWQDDNSSLMNKIYARITGFYDPEKAFLNLYGDKWYECRNCPKMKNETCNVTSSYLLPEKEQNRKIYLWIFTIE